MLYNLAVGMPTMLLCLALQVLVFVYAIRRFGKRSRQRETVELWSSLRLISTLMVILVIGNLAQIVIWAALFRLVGEFESLQDAIYHSAVNFATLGYGDLVMSESNRLLGPLEAINGALMIGVSTAALTGAFHHEVRGLTGHQKG